MAVKLRLKRFGRLNHPTYRLCAPDARSPRDGRIIESLGYYLPKVVKADQQLGLNAERITYWLSVGAQPSETVASLIRRAGIPLPSAAKGKKPKRPKVAAKAKAFVPPRKKKRRQKVAESGS